MLSVWGDKIVARLPLRLQNIGRQFIKFSLTGTVGAIVDFSTYNFITRGLGFTASYLVLGQPIIIANNVSVLLAIVSNFLLNKYWTFRDKSQQVVKQWTAYFLLNFTTWVLNQLLVSIFTFRLAILESIFGNQKDNAAKVLAIGIILMLNFFGSKWLIFKRATIIKRTVIGPTTPIR